LRIQKAKQSELWQSLVGGWPLIELCRYSELALNTFAARSAFIVAPWPQCGKWQ
jgi:hypothetical protein